MPWIQLPPFTPASMTTAQRDASFADPPQTLMLFNSDAMGSDPWDGRFQMYGVDEGQDEAWMSFLASSPTRLTFPNLFTNMGNAFEALTISGGSITATRSSIVVDTQGGAGTDDLDAIVGGEPNDLLILIAANPAREVVLKHANGASDSIFMEDDSDLPLNQAGDIVLLLRSSVAWHVIGRGTLHMRQHDHADPTGGSDLTLYPLVDGSRGFTGVVPGILPTASNHLATKEYVDSAIAFITEYFFNDTASDIGGIYSKMLDTPTGEGESTFTTAGLGQGDDQALENFATDAAIPGLAVLEAGIYGGHIHAEVTVGNKPTKIHFEIYSRTDPGGVETLVATSEESAFITGKVEVDLHATLASDVTIATTDRIIVKWLANVDATGGDVTVVLYAEGTTGSHLEVPLSTDVLNQVFVRQDGTKAMTGDLNLDGNNLDNVGVAFLKEQAEADADVAGSGQVWVNTATPNELWFTGDDGIDQPLTVPKRSFQFNASSLFPNITDGCDDAVQRETTTHKKNYVTRAFAVNELGTIDLDLPPNYDGGTVTWWYKFIVPTGASAGDTVIFGLRGSSTKDDESLDAAPGAQVTITYTLPNPTAAVDVAVSAESSALTIAGTPVGGDAVTWEVERTGGDMAEEAWLWRVYVRYPTDNSEDV